MTAVWPPGLPFFNRQDDHSRTARQGAVQRTAMERGPAKTRRVSTAATRLYVGSIPWLDEWQFGEFRAFVHETIGDGALPFTATDPRDGLTRTFRFVGSDDPYQALAIGRKWRISATLEIMAEPPRATVSTAARVSGDPAVALAGATLTGVPAVYAGEPGALAHRWVRSSDGAVVGTAQTYTTRTADIGQGVAYRTIAINGPSSTSAFVTVVAEIVDDWLLETGFWDDAAIWDDASNWKDAP